MSQLDVRGAVTDLIGFIALFLAAGAVGFRFVPLRRVVTERDLFDRAAKRAAVLGLIGALITLFMVFAFSLPQAAARQHLSVSGVVVKNVATGAQVACLVLAVIGFGLAMSRVAAGWVLAAIGVVLNPLTGLLTGKWARVINPIHSIAAAFWIGTLFIILVAGFTVVLRSSLDPVRRGAIAAEMIHAFSPFALGSFAVLAIFGLITAYRHLKPLSSLWTTSYGYALIVKLVIVAIVVALGAFNWRRQRPLLGTEEAASVLKRSATAEVAFAAVVLVITAVLVNLPSP